MTGPVVYIGRLLWQNSFCLTENESGEKREISYNERKVSITPGSGGILAFGYGQGEQYKKPFMLNECGAYIYRAYISGMSEDEIMQAFKQKNMDCHSSAHKAT